MKLSVHPIETFSFASQVKQYPELGPKGIDYFAGVLPDITVDCLLYRDKSGKVRGILNHYPKTVGILGTGDYEKKGNVNIFIDPRFKRQGIATKLLAEAERRWTINFQQQRYTLEGEAFIKAYLRGPGLRCSSASGRLSHSPGSNH